MSVQAPALVVDETTTTSDLKRARLAIDRATGEVVKDSYGRASSGAFTRVYSAARPSVHHAPRPHDPRDLADVGVVATTDAMSVGLSMRTHARTKLVGETQAAHLRVADSLIAAARRALAEGK